MTELQSNASQRRLQVVSQQLLGSAGSRNTLQSNPCSASANQSPMLEGQVAIVTGSGKGIGAATALLLASHGACVVVSDLDASAASEVAEKIKGAGGRAISVTADVTAPSAAADIISQTVAAFGPKIHILVNNAGFTWDGVVHKMSAEQWQTMLDVHCTAPFRLIQAAAPYMRDAARKEKEATGSAAPRCIINISSSSGTHGNAGQANYSTAKAGVVGLTKSIAKEWGPLNIRCNALAYGLIDTRLTRAKEGGESITVGGKKVALGIPGASSFKDLVKATTPLQRVGTADEAAGAIMMLVCPWASYVTGQVIEVNGGAFM
eukprot:gene8251-1520_t